MFSAQPVSMDTILSLEGRLTAHTLGALTTSSERLLSGWLSETDRNVRGVIGTRGSMDLGAASPPM